jgi:hypothetical protein
MQAPVVDGLVAALQTTSNPTDRLARAMVNRNQKLVLGSFLAALVAFIGGLGVGVVRRWRWMFWLSMVAFLAGVLRVPAVILQLPGVLTADAPTWYLLFQACWGSPVRDRACSCGWLRQAGVWGAP